MLATITRTQEFRDVMLESFIEAPDGYWYPIEGASDRALVRVQFGGDAYSIERRRNLGSPWLPVVTAELAEFDLGVFRRWRNQWPMIQSV